MQLKHCVFLFTLLILPLPAVAQESGTSFNGAVVAVKDGDTIEVLRSGRAVTVRLHGIDAPEMAQPFGSAAKRATSSYAFGKAVRIEVTRHFDQAALQVGVGGDGDPECG